jgi:uncharacterized protein YkwD
MQKAIISFFLLISISAKAQNTDFQHTAKNCTYMSVAEREMIYEINRVRSQPRSYIQYISPRLVAAKEKLKKDGKGPRNFSLRYTSTNGIDKLDIDTIWHYTNEEEVNALSSLVRDLENLKPLSILLPDEGIYKAVSAHSRDQDAHGWQLGHTGTDGSRPWDRILKYSLSMEKGNENIAGNSDNASPRDFVIQLLVDDGIPGYGHRYNMLNPEWTHVACKSGKGRGMNWWIQNFGKKKAD